MTFDLYESTNLLSTTFTLTPMLRTSLLFLVLSACDGQLAGEASTNACPVCPVCPTSPSSSDAPGSPEPPPEDAAPEACHGGVELVRVPCAPGRPPSTACFEFADSCD